MEIPFIIIGTAALAVILLVLGVVVWKSRDSYAPDYRGWFYIGLIWLPIGVVMALTLDNPGYWFFAVMGLVFTALGWKNRDKWKQTPKFADLTPGQKRLKLVLIGVVLLFLLAGSFLYVYLETLEAGTGW